MQAYILVHVRDEHDAHLFRDKYPVYVPAPRAGL